MDLKQQPKQTLVDFEKGVDSLTAEIGPIFGRKLNVRITFFVVYILKKPCLKLDVCAFIISFRRFSNAKSTAENTYHDRVWHFLQLSCVQVQHYV